MKKNLSFFIILFFASCVFKAKNVLMIPRSDESGIIKLYYDREGELYPPDVHVTPYYFYLQQLKKSKTKQSNPEFATVESALTRYDSLSKDFVRKQYHLEDKDSIRLFRRLQNILQKNVILQMKKSMNEKKCKHLIFLIHGFNDPAPDAYYFSLRSDINAYTKEKPTYVEVYWDGLTSLGAHPALAGIWEYAQTNSAKVGLGIRKILNNIDTDTKITILTHSLGASVATHILFNPFTWPEKFQEKLEADYQSDKIPTPQQNDIRLGMLAPAIGGTDEFNFINNTVPTGTTTHLKILVVGYNHYDYAVTKGGLFPRWFGNTSFGADAKKEVSKTFDGLKQKAPDLKTVGIDFSYIKKINTDTLSKKAIKALKPLRQYEHAILFYEKNEHFVDFLHALLQ
jgi:hypothetical protein